MASIVCKNGMNATTRMMMLPFRFLLVSNCRFLTTTASTLCARNQGKQTTKKTSLFDYHVQQGGKMVDFAGWMMPVVFSHQTIVQSHLHTRKSVSIFDVSHMMQSKVYGKNRFKFIEGLVVSDIQGLQQNQGTLTVFTNEKGGILDDLIVTNTSNDYLYIVSNAGCRDSDLKLFMDHLEVCHSKGMDVQLEVLDIPLIAVQGPGVCKVLQPGVKENLSNLPFMHTMQASVFGVDNCRITRCGYTGEDGVEISIPQGMETQIMDRLLSSTADSVKLAGLGARDSLRLEAGLCLYGSDIDVNTTPVEATLAWLISQRRRQTADFPGASVILEQLKSKPMKKRVGFITKTGPAPRAGTRVLSSDGKLELGHITSGCPAPSLQYNIAMGYLNSTHAKAGTEIQVSIRNKLYEGVVAKIPFLPSKYFIK